MLCRTLPLLHCASLVHRSMRRACRVARRSLIQAQLVAYRCSDVVVNINTATVEELLAVGFSASVACRVVSRRPFSSVAELHKVYGCGKQSQLYRALRQRVVFTV